MGRRRAKLVGGRELMALTNEDKDRQRILVPVLTSFLSGFVHHLSRYAFSAFHHVCPKRENFSGSHIYYEQQLMITFLPSQYLSFSSGSSPWGQIPSSSLMGRPEGSSRQTPTSDAATTTAVDGSVPAASTGPAFVGQVFTMCDASRRGLIAVRPVDSAKTKKTPYLPAFISSKLGMWVDKALGNVNEDKKEGPVFRFYFDKDDAGTYVKRLGLAGSMVGTCPLDAAYKFFKGRPSMFRFMADKRQVKVAKKMLRKDQGKAAARMFSGVPVFTARNLTIAMTTSNGVRWFTPYFFDKEHLDKLIGHSVDHYYQMLIHARRSQRRSQIADDFSSGDQPEDEFMDPPEVQELLEEMGQAAPPIFDSVLLKAVEIQFQDMIDSVILGNRLSRQLAGLQPSFPVLVDSFERRAAAAEPDLSGRLKTSLAESKVGDETRSRDCGQNDEGSSTSGSDSGDIGFSGGRGQKHERAAKFPFQLFGKNWGFHLNGGRKQLLSDEHSDDDKSEEDTSAGHLGSRSTKTAEGKEDGIDRMEPKLTMIGIATTEADMADVVLQKAMVAAANDIEDRVRKGEGAGIEHGPLFIANLGGSSEIWAGYPTPVSDPDDI